MKPVLKSKIASAVLYVIAFLVTIGALLIVATRKPKAVFPAMDKDKTQVLFLGDTEHDWACARDAGCDFALADWKGRGDQGIPARYKFSDAEAMERILIPTK